MIKNVQLEKSFFEAYYTNDRI